MTQQVPQTLQANGNQSDPDPPRIVLLVTDHPKKIAEGGGPTPEIYWRVGELHPLIPNSNKGPDVRIIAIYTADPFVEIYSKNSTGSICLRDLIHFSRVRFTQEMMAEEVFMDELARAESGEDPGEDEEEEEEDDKPDASSSPDTSLIPSINGQAKA